MTIRIKKRPNVNPIIDKVQSISGVDLGSCYQCKKCSCGCTVSGFVQSPPSEIIRRLQLGAGNELLDSDLVWTCVSCEICFARCPMGIDTASLMDAMRALALEKRAATPEGNIPFFNKAFLKTVSLFGRTYDLAMITAYKMKTSTFAKDMDKFPAMIKKRKIAFLPTHDADKKTVSRIFKNIHHARRHSE